METNSTTTNQACVSRMQLNDTKAGMQNLDKDKINAIILKHSQNSRFYLKQQKRENEQRSRAQEKLIVYNKFSLKDIQNAKNHADKFIDEIEKSRDLTRVLVHIDMDAFYANVEIRDNPNLADKPMAVGSDSMLSTSNYVARRYGVRAAMPGFIAKELCPDLIIVPCNYKKYRVESHKIMETISKYDANYSAMSLDEAYLDLTENLVNRAGLSDQERTFPKSFGENDPNDVITFGTDVEGCVQEIRHRIYLATELTASAGIACNLRLAKLCSDVNKPNGQFRLESDREKILDFVENLPIRKINGIGPSTALILDCYGIKICRDLYEKRDMIFLLETQNTFEFLMTVCRGLGGNRIVHDDERKSLGHETTFSSKISGNKEEILKIIYELSEDVSNELIKDELMARKVNIKIKTVNFETYTRTRSMGSYTDKPEPIYEAAKFLFLNEWENSRGKLRLRLIGVRVSDLNDSNSIPSSSPPQKSTKTIDNFFKKSENKEISTNFITNDFCVDLKLVLYERCPGCSSYLEGNEDFIKYHLDNCLTDEYYNQKTTKETINYI